MKAVQQDKNWRTLKTFFLLLILSLVCIHIINNNSYILKLLLEKKYAWRDEKEILLIIYMIFIISLSFVIFFLFRVFVFGIGILVDRNYITVIHIFHKIKIPINSIKYIESQHHHEISLKEIYGNKGSLWVVAISSAIGSTLIPIHWISFNSKDEALKLSLLLNAKLKHYDQYR